MFEKGIAIVALTKWGVATSTRIARGLEKAQIPYTIYAPERLRSDGITPFNGGLDALFAKVFNIFDAVIPVMAVGIVVRSIAPFIANKTTDPAVVVVDDFGKFAISLLSGHIRGANRLTKIVAGEIGSIPVVTTATDLLGRKPVEEIAEEHDLVIANSESLTPVNSAIVNEQKILFATIDPVTRLETDVAPPKLISSVDQLEEMMEDYDAAIVIAPSIVSLESVTKPVALLIPRSTRRLPVTSNDLHRTRS
jgi:cobalt-precorrin 5A hydrolase